MSVAGACEEVRPISTLRFSAASRTRPASSPYHARTLLPFSSWSKAAVVVGQRGPIVPGRGTVSSHSAWAARTRSWLPVEQASGSIAVNTFCRRYAESGAELLHAQSATRRLALLCVLV
jgi:hypothetical protein